MTQERRQFVRRVTLLPAVAINMTQMCGIGPFITIPVMVATMGGPQAIIGWIAGAILAMADGLVWAELGAAMPGAGGTYLYLREAFQYRTGKLMPFMFIWTVMLSIPFGMATGVIGLVQYVEFFGHLDYWAVHVTAHYRDRHIRVVAAHRVDPGRHRGIVGHHADLGCRVDRGELQ